MLQDTENGIVSLLAHGTVEEIVDRVRGMLAEKGVHLFAIIDHSGEAEKVGLRMRPTKLLLFGNPRSGTPVMLAAPSVAIDLPLKLLVWQDNEDRVWVSYNSPEYLQRRHSIPKPLITNLAALEKLAQSAAE